MSYVKALEGCVVMLPAAEVWGSVHTMPCEEGTGGRKMRCFTVMEPVMSQPGGTRRIGLRERPGDNIPAGFLSASRMDEWNMGCQL